MGQWSSGTSRLGLRPGRLGQLRVPAIERTPNVPALAGHAITTRHKCSDPDCRRNTPDRRIGTAESCAGSAGDRAPIIPFWKPRYLLRDQFR